MKMIRLLVVLGFSIATVQGAEKEVKLLGVTSGFGENVAVVDVGGNSPEWLRVTSLRTGQSYEGVEMGNIDAAKGTATVKLNGAEHKLSMPADSDQGSANEIDPSLPIMYFHALPLDLAIGLYASYDNRTALIHPKIGTAMLSLKVNPRTQAEAVKTLERLFREHYITTIPDGEHFVMVVPSAFTNLVTPRSGGLPQTNSVVPAMSINFHTAPMPLVIQTYADFTHKQIVNLHDNTWLTPGGPFPVVTLTQTTPLSREEIDYALKTLIEWNNIRMTPDGDGKLKLERAVAR